MVDDFIMIVEFVIFVLRDFFDKFLEEVKDFILSIYCDGEGVCGVYFYDIVRYRVVWVKDKVKVLEFFLKLLVEEIK